jgi:hypothetical protein
MRVEVHILTWIRRETWGVDQLILTKRYKNLLDVRIQTSCNSLRNFYKIRKALEKCMNSRKMRQEYKSISNDKSRILEWTNTILMIRFYNYSSKIRSNILAQDIYIPKDKFSWGGLGWCGEGWRRESGSKRDISSLPTPVTIDLDNESWSPRRIPPPLGDNVPFIRLLTPNFYLFLSPFPSLSSVHFSPAPNSDSFPKYIHV